MKYLYVGFGGAIGSLLRYLVSVVSIHIWGNGFPCGTLFANWTGAFILAWFTKSVIQKERLNPNLILLIGTGIIGSFTTFSTLSIETVLMIEQNRFTTAFIYLSFSMIGGLLAAFCGYQLGSRKRVGEQG